MNIVREQREQNNSLIKVTVGEKDYGDAVVEPGDGRWYDGAFFKEVDVQLDPETEP